MTLPCAVMQLSVVGGLGIAFSADLCLCMTLQTIAFVAFNKVITAQYFMWYIGLLPLALCRFRLSWKLMLAWLLAEVHSTTCAPSFACIWLC